jgi:hypothetical protein
MGPHGVVWGVGLGPAPAPAPAPSTQHGAAHRTPHIVHGPWARIMGHGRPSMVGPRAPRARARTRTRTRTRTPAHGAAGRMAHGNDMRHETWRTAHGAAWRVYITNRHRQDPRHLAFGIWQ